MARFLPLRCINRANRAAHFGLLPTSRQAASTSAHRNSPEPSLVIFRSLDFRSPLCRTTGTSPAYAQTALAFRNRLIAPSPLRDPSAGTGPTPRGGLEDLPGL